MSEQRDGALMSVATLVEKWQPVEVWLVCRGCSVRYRGERPKFYLDLAERDGVEDPWWWSSCPKCAPDEASAERRARRKKKKADTPDTAPKFDADRRGKPANQDLPF